MNTIKRYREIIVYLFFGALTVLLNCVLYVLFNHFWGYEFANGIGNALANFICILFAYVTNRTAVFCSKSSGISAIREIVCFIVGRLGTLVLDTGIMIFAGIYIGAHYGKPSKQSRKSEKSGADSAERTIRTSSKAESFAKSAEKNWFVIGKVMVRCIFTVHLAMFPSQRKTSGTALTRSCTNGWKNTVICRSWYGKALEKANSNQKK